MTFSLAFVLAPRQFLPPDGPTSWEALEQAQSHGIRDAMALRLFCVSPDGLAALPDLGFEGSLASSMSKQGKCRLICDAVIPRFDTETLWLAVFAVRQLPPGSELADGTPPGSRTMVEPLDRFPLEEAENEACWFYPTEDGSYLSWENRRQLSLAPGGLADPALAGDPADYRRSDIHVLWSLMADDAQLTCVGLTWKGVRLVWPERQAEPAAAATWRAFEVVSSADPAYRPLGAHSVERPAPAAG